MLSIIKFHSGTPPTKKFRRFSIESIGPEGAEVGRITTILVWAPKLQEEMTAESLREESEKYKKSIQELKNTQWSMIILQRSRLFSTPQRVLMGITS